MLTAERVIAGSLMALSIYFMIHATALPIGWEASTGPGGGAFPFWLSAVMLLAAGGILFRSFALQFPDGIHDERTYFDRRTLKSVVIVSGLLIATITLIPIIGAYLALMAFLVAYLRFFGSHGWVLTGTLTVATPLFLFFFFEVTLKILLPKGITEPLFIPLYAMFF